MSISVLGIDIGKNNFHLFDKSVTDQKSTRKKNETTKADEVYRQPAA